MTHKDLPRGGGVVISPNLIKTKHFVDLHGNIVNNLKEKRPIESLKEKVEITPEEIQEVVRKSMGK